MPPSLGADHVWRTAARCGTFHAEELSVKIRVLSPEEVEQVGNALGLARLYQGNGFYLVAWRGDESAGHLHLALTDPPELQDVQVAAGHRRRGVATMLIAAAEREARARDFTRIRVDDNARTGRARRLNVWPVRGPAQMGPHWPRAVRTGGPLAGGPSPAGSTCDLGLRGVEP